ncbi:MAG: Protein-arginine-phosphatase [Chloroflexi bacterium]|nr:Protein-arginine-phosphatase [Chloroflexota bacterium]
MPSVLFVCTANIIRSPMAEALFRRQVGEGGHGRVWRVSSAGTWTRGGDPPHPTVLELLGEMGIDLHGHRSREVDESLLAAADIVLVMERSHKEALQIEFPEDAKKIYLLSELQGVERDIVDPIGSPEIEYLTTFLEIQDYLQDAPNRIMELIKN